MKNSIFAIVDTETTGIRSESDRIIEIGIVLVKNGEILEKYQSLINPGRPISPVITEINGITDSDLVTAPLFDEVALEIKELLDGAIFVAHNASFDYQFIRSEFRRLGIPFQMPYLCSVKLSRALYPNERNHNLDALISRHRLSCESRHRAYDDAYAVYQFMEIAKKKFGAKHFWDTTDSLTLGLGSTNESKERVLPAVPGVYYFYGKENETLYIGKSKNIRTRVRSHFAPSSGEQHLKRGTVRVETHATPGELSALLLESREIKNNSPLYNRMLRKTRKMIVAYEEKTESGYLTVRLRTETQIDPDASIAALFRTMTAAREKIRQLTREHALCQKIMGLEKSSTACFGVQIESCQGACLNKEDPHAYNERFREAFKRRRIKTWPFKDTIVIEEKSTVEGEGVFFLIKDWRIVKSVLYEGTTSREFLPADTYFDYDTYKILVRYVLSPANRRNIRPVSSKESQKMQTELSEEFEPVIMLN